MLGLSWHLPGYQPDDTPPGGALIFSLWRQTDSGGYFVRTQYLAQTLVEMRSSSPITLSAPPAKEDVSAAGCESATVTIGRSWDIFTKAIEGAIDNRFVSM